MDCLLQQSFASSSYSEIVAKARHGLLTEMQIKIGSGLVVVVEGSL